jgi:hypothetical protein
MAKKPVSKKRIFIFVQGGVIQTIATDPGIQVMVLDGDTDGVEGCEIYKDFDGEDFDAREAWDKRATEVSSKLVSHYFKQRKS